MNREQRVAILKRFEQLAFRESENISAERQVRAFLPLPAHRLALRKDKVVVLGGRGAGKSALFRLLSETSAQLGFFFDEGAPEATTWLNGYSVDDKAHAQPVELDALASTVDNERLRLYWTLHLLEVLAAGAPHCAQVPEPLVQVLKETSGNLQLRLERALPFVGLLTKALDDADEKLAARKASVSVAYDQIDRLGEHNAQTRARLAGALLSLWLTLSNRYRNLSAKVFLRHDVFEDAQRTFADASKLKPRSVSLDWDVESLFRVVVRHLANDVHGDTTSLAETRAWLEGLDGLALRTDKKTGVTPEEMPEEVQRAFGIAVAGEFMGTGARKGRTYKWIVNHLQDAHGTVVPRSILSLLGYAANLALKAPLHRGPALMTTTNLTQALVETSKGRVTEVGEEYKVIARLENMRNASLLMARKQALKLLSARAPGEKELISGDGEFVLDELCRLGVLKVREDGRIDVPDIYRYGYGIKRKGGARQAV
jgi:hypothetical protein